MPRHSTDYSLHSPSSSDSMAARPRPKSSSKSLPSLHQLISDDIPSNGHDASKPNHPKTGGKCIGLIESMSDESTSSSESEEEDDGDSDDDEPDVLGPAGLTQDTDTTITAGSSSSKKRAFDDADLTLTLDDFCTAGDDTDFPRKRISLDMSESLMPSCNASTVGDTEDDYAGLDLLDDDGMDGLLGDEEELENEEVAAIIQEIEQQDKDSPNSFLLDSEDMAQFELAEDLNSELFSAEWESSNLLFNHITSDNDIDLFNVHLTTAESTPAATPKGSDFSSAFPPATPLDSCTDNNDISSEDDIFDFNALFDRPSKQIAAYASNMASLSDIDIDSDDAELAKYFFSSEDSGNETDREDDSDDGMTDDDEGDTTEEEDDLPMPTPRHQSKLRRVSVSSASAVRPQVIRMDAAAAGIQASSWLADPSRPIIVVEDNRQTVILPSEFGVPSGGESDHAPNPFSGNSWEESESDTHALATNFDPTLGGLTELGGGALNGNDILGPPEAFYPYTPIDGDMQQFFDDIDMSGLDFDIDSGADSAEAALELEDFLDMSSPEDKKGDELDDILEEMENGTAGEDEEGDEEGCADGRNSPTAMLHIWDKVSVTAFRKRQVQHQQKLASLHISGSSPTNYGYHKGRDRRLSETLTPSKKRKVRQKFLANARGASGSSKQSHRSAR